MFKRLHQGLLFASIYYPAQVWAGVGHSAEHGGKPYEKTVGLPQLDASTFPSQIFWLIVIFVILYFFLARKTLPEISSTIEKRSELISNDLDTAERLKDEVASVQKSYEDSLAEARLESAAIYSKIEQKIKDKSDKASKEFHENSAKKVRGLEKSIEKAKKKAIKEMSTIAADVAMESAEKITGIQIDSEFAKSVVDSILDQPIKKAA